MAELIQYQLSRDANNLPNGDIIYPSKYINAYVLAAGSPKTVNIPTGARVAMFSATNNYYVNFTGAAAEPAGDIINGYASELNPVARDVTGYTTFSVVSPAACILTIAFFV
jgi:hypothetical protein